MNLNRNIPGKVFLLAAAVALLVNGNVASAADADIAAFIKGNRMFAQELYSKLSGDGGNIVFSPLGVSSVMAAVYSGASGETQAQIAKTLQFPKDSQALAVSLKQLMGELSDASTHGKDKLTFANALWYEKGFSLTPEFMKEAGAQYRSHVQALDFVKDAKGALALMNEWAVRETEGRTRDIGLEGVVNPSTRVVLTNLTYFMGQWADPFPATATADGPFTLADGSVVHTPFMRRKGPYRVFEDDVVRCIELPYAQGALVMVIALPGPKSPGGTAKAEIDPQALEKGLSRMSERKVALSLPKWRLTNKLPLSATLKSMGLTAPFSIEDADFSGMTGKKDLFLAEVMQEVFVQVDEKGTEAAAATSGVQSVKTSFSQPKEFKVDRPFLFWIQDGKTGAVLFQGEVINPAA